MGIQRYTATRAHYQRSWPIAYDLWLRPSNQGVTVLYQDHLAALAAKDEQIDKLRAIIAKRDKQIFRMGNAGNSMRQHCPSPTALATWAAACAGEG